MDSYDISSETVGYLACRKCSNRYFRQSIYGTFDHSRAACPACAEKDPIVLKQDVTNDIYPVRISVKLKIGE